MAQPGIMGEIVVKHFKRSTTSAADKELVIEIVAGGSDTGRFLRRMEESRLTRPCFQTIDMRDRVAGECRRYAFNDRIHYLDDVSFEMFEQGLRENNGVYTVGTFEAIMGGSHTLQAQETAREEAERRRQEIEQRRLERLRAAALERAGGSQEAVPAVADLSAEVVENPELLPLGYFRRRTHPRLQYACTVELERGNIKTRATTRDISVCGIRVHMKGLTTFKPGQDIMVSWVGLRELAEAESPRAGIAHIPYRVVSGEERDGETVLCLSRADIEKPAGFSPLLETLVERYRNKYKLDVDDEYQSILSWYYERCYAQSATQVPFFVARDAAGALHVQAVAMSEGNSHLARFFCTDADNYNFTPLCLPHRLQQLEQGGSFLLAMYRQRGEQDQCMRIHSAADFEFAAPADFEAMLRHTLEQSEHSIVKVHVSCVPALPVSDRKVDEVSQRLQYKSETGMSELREQLKQLHYVGYVVDITQDFQVLKKRKGAGHSELAVWVGGERRRLGDAAVQEKLSIDAEDMRPELIRFGYVERRREDRYLAETRVEVRIGDKVIPGMSKDISTRGMRVQLLQQLVVKQGATVKVGLVSLQQKKTTNLMDIPYRVVHTRDEDDGTILMLERILGGKREGLKEFFVELITKNQHKLGVDIGDIWGATTSRVYEALLAANTPTVPFFLARNAEGGAHLQFVGVPDASSPLLEYFKVADGVDFRCLNERRVVSGLYDAVQILLRQSRNSSETPTPFSLEMYLYKELDELTGETFIHAASELDFPSDTLRETFLAKLTGFNDWRCIKILATFSQSLDEKVLDKMVDSVRCQSKHRAIKLSDLAHSLVGYGEMIDITAEWLALRAGRGE